MSSWILRLAMFAPLVVCGFNSTKRPAKCKVEKLGAHYHPIACKNLPYATETIGVALSGEVRCISMGW